MNNILNQCNLPQFNNYKLNKVNNKDQIIKQFFLNNHMTVLEKYIEILPKPNNIINFDELKTLYLLDKDLRTCIYTVLEEIETSLKSFMQTYVNIHDIDLTDRNIYYKRPISNNKYDFINTLDKLRLSNVSIFDLYFSDISKIISLIGNNQDFIKDLHSYFMPNFQLAQFKQFIFTLSRLRNKIAHHESCIIFCKNERNYNLKKMLQSLYTMLNNIRDENNQSSWLERVENDINKKLDGYNNIRIVIGYQ